MAMKSHKIWSVTDSAESRRGPFTHCYCGWKARLHHRQLPGLAGGAQRKYYALTDLGQKRN